MPSAPSHMPSWRELNPAVAQRLGRGADVADVPAEHRVRACGVIRHHGHPREAAPEVDEIAEVVRALELEAERLAIELECALAILYVEKGDGRAGLQDFHVMSPIVLVLQLRHSVRRRPDTIT